MVLKLDGMLVDRSGDLFVESGEGVLALGFSLQRADWPLLAGIQDTSMDFETSEGVFDEDVATQYMIEQSILTNNKQVEFKDIFSKDRCR